ncbi:MAG: 23S rRNA (guanosine(2251)-2'-O)-methyltransferase RlmB [Planctomycetota bacterium]|nr:23S rRNA (guanosine(2251)-2'-O)-methyltransferase RlmB [Planctomycetota bacterium]
MVERYRRGKGKQQLLGSHQKCWIWGRHLVRETLSAGYWPILELLIADDLPEHDRSDVHHLSEERQIPLKQMPTDRLTQLGHTSEHQGYLAKMPPYPYREPIDLLADGVAAGAFLLLDRIQDPHNFGAIIRSAEVLGMDGIFVGSQEQVPVTSLVARSSAGAVNHLPMAQTDNLVNWAGRLQREFGYELIGAHQEATTEIWNVDLAGPVVFIIGNEGTGIRSELMELCDRRIRIPQQGSVSSLNAAVAAGILCYETRRQRDRQ